MDFETISFEEFLCCLKKDAENYFKCECIGEKHDDEEISLKMSLPLGDYDEEKSCKHFDGGYEQWHINYIHLDGNAATFSYKNLDEKLA